MIRTYSKLISIPDYRDRIKYLMINGRVGAETFGYDRYLNQRFYTSKEWGPIRDFVITRDLGCDLAMKGYEISGSIYVHHMNPIRLDDIQNSTEYLLDPEYLVCTSFKTHNLIHYGYEHSDLDLPSERKPNDMCPWKH